MKQIKLTKSGEYMCSACRSAPKEGRFHRRWKWKTESGFINHDCIVDIQRWRKDSEKQYKIEQEKKLSEWKGRAKYKIGDSFWYYYYFISKPTHEQRGNRTVRVRYEEVRDYRMSQGTITGIDFLGLYSFGYNQVPELNIFDSKQECECAMENARSGYKEACDFASMVR